MRKYKLSLIIFRLCCLIIVRCQSPILAKLFFFFSIKHFKQSLIIKIFFVEIRIVKSKAIQMAICRLRLLVAPKPNKHWVPSGQRSRRKLKKLQRFVSLSSHSLSLILTSSILFLCTAALAFYAFILNSKIHTV